MDTIAALSALQALSQDTRLNVFRLLIRAGADGLSAGDIATACEVRQNTMSSHLAILTQAGLIASERDGRTIIYRADINGIQGLLEFLIADCCGGEPEECQPLIKQLAC